MKQSDTRRQRNQWFSGADQGFKDNTHDPDGVNHLNETSRVHLRAQKRTQHVDDVRLWIELVIPDVLKDMVSRPHPPSVR